MRSPAYFFSMTASSFPLGTSEGAHAAPASVSANSDISAAALARASAAYKMPARPYKRTSICAIPPGVRRAKLG